MATMSSLFLCFHLSLRQNITSNAEQDLKSYMLWLWKLDSFICADYGKVHLSDSVAYMVTTLFSVKFFLYKIERKNGNNFENTGIVLRGLAEVDVRIPT